MLNYWFLTFYASAGLLFAEGSIVAARRAGKKFGASAYVVVVAAWPLVLVTMVLRR